MNGGGQMHRTTVATLLTPAFPKLQPAGHLQPISTY